MRRPMIALAIACLLLPLALPWTLPALAPAAGIALTSTAAASSPPGLAWLAGSGAVIALLGGLLWWRLRRTISAAPSSRAGTWDCGYAAPDARMQYTFASYGSPLGRDLAPDPIRPPEEVLPARGLFPVLARFTSRRGDGILDRWLTPLAGRCAYACLRLRLLQQGSLHAYLGYVLITVVLLLAAAMART
jgi:hypothetical protein